MTWDAFTALRAIRELDVPASQRVVLYALASRGDQVTGHSWPSLQRLAKDTGQHWRTCMRALASLEADGLVERVGKAGVVTRYALQLPTPTPDTESVLHSQPTPDTESVTPDTESVPPLTESQGTPDTESDKVPKKYQEEEPKKNPSPKPGADVRRVFAHWQQATGHPRAKLDAKRSKRIRARLREGFTPEQLEQAISARVHDPWLMGLEGSPRVFDGIETLLRDATKVEELLDLHAKHARRPAAPAKPEPVITHRLDPLEMARGIGA